MKFASRRGFVAPVAWLAGTGLCAALIGTAALLAPSAGEAALPAGPGGVHALNPDLLYLGSASCTGAGCHSGEAKKRGDRMIGDENTLWEESDPHSKAFKSLTNEKGKKIAAAMKIEDAGKSAKCTQCHAQDAPKKGEKFKDIAKEAVGCESCHGAAQKWNEPHQKEGWTDGQRKAGGAAGLLKDFGMVDTNDLAVRANMCVSCHLQIDKDLLTAGHPALEFEMYSYNNYKFNEKWKMHWDEHGGPQRKTTIWAVGQLAGAANADGQPTAPVFAAGKKIVKDAFGTDDIAAMAKMETIPADKVKAALTALVASADAFKDGKDNKLSRSIVTSGVDALVSTLVAKAPDAYFDAVDAAAKAEGAAWVDTLKKMAGFAK